MKSSQEPLLSLGPAEVAQHAREISAQLQASIDAYGQVTGSAVEAEITDIVARNLGLYLRTLTTGTLPQPDELEEFATVCGRRLRQGFPLEAVLRAGRLESQGMWEVVRARAPEERLPALVSLTMRYMDAVHVASERGYVLAREHLARSLNEASRLFLSRLIRGDFADDAEAAGEAGVLGFDLARFWIGIVVEPDRAPTGGRRAVDLLLVDAATELASTFPGSPWGLVESGLVLAVAATSPEEVGDLVGGALATHSSGPKLVVGLGSPRVGSGGLRASFAEARRALALGSVLNAQQRVHRYDDLRVFDLFKDDGTVASFAQEVLGPLLAQDRARRTHMIDTLDAFFASGMVRKAAAARLDVHPNTLDYRLREIEASLGFPVRFGQSAFKLQLALKLLPLATTVQASRTPREVGRLS